MFADQKNIIEKKKTEKKRKKEFDERKNEKKYPHIVKDGRGEPH